VSEPAIPESIDAVRAAATVTLHTLAKNLTFFF
jgi:hypothetical protein